MSSSWICCDFLFLWVCDFCMVEESLTVNNSLHLLQVEF